MACRTSREEEESSSSGGSSSIVVVPTFPPLALLTRPSEADAEGRVRVGEGGGGVDRSQSRPSSRWRAFASLREGDSGYLQAGEKKRSPSEKI